MAEDLGVSPGELRSVSSELHEVSSELKELMSSLHAQLADAGAAWGGDEMGHHFAVGPNGYLAQRDWVDGSVEAKTGLLDYYSNLLRHVANSFEQADNIGQTSPAAANGSGTRGGGSAGGGSAPPVGNGMAGSASAGAIPRTGSGYVPTTGAANHGGPPANGSAPPGGAGGGRGGGAPSGGGEPELPSSPGRTPLQGGSAGEGPGSGDAAPTAPGNGDVAGDAATAGVDAEDGTTMPGASSPQGMPNSSMDSSDDERSTDRATSAPPNSPPLPSLPKPPNPPNPRRSSAPDPPAPPSQAKKNQAKDEQSARPSAPGQVDSDKQHNGSGRVARERAGAAGAGRPTQDGAVPPGRLRSVTGRAGVAGGNTMSEGVAHARSGRRGSGDESLPKRTGNTSSSPAASSRPRTS